MSEHREGPVRSEAARVAILEATARQFAARGYDHLTMEGVAADAGVAKQTIYRWWPSKAALVADCLIEGRLMPRRLMVPTGGDLRADLISWLGDIYSVIQAPGGDVLVVSLIAAATQNVEVGRRIHESLGAASPLTERLQVAIEAGQLRPDAPLDEISEALVGVVLLRALSQTPADLAAIERLVDALIGGRSAPE